MRLGLGLPPQADLVAQVDDAADGEEFGGDAKANEEHYEPFIGMILVLAGELEELVQNLEPEGPDINREPDDTDQDQVLHDAALPRVPVERSTEKCRDLHRHSRSTARGRAIKLNQWSFSGLWRPPRPAS
jgi:hypothetical protein